MENIIQSFTSFGHEDAEKQYQNVYHMQQEDPHHKASLGHEAIAGAAGFAAMKAYESHLRASGKELSHPLMKEILAGIAAAEVDKLVETKGLDFIDRHKAKKMAERQAQALAEQRYGGGTGFQYAQAQGGYAAPYNYSSGAPFGAQSCPSYGYGRYAPLPQGYALPPQGYYPPPQGYAPYGVQPGFNPTPDDGRHHHHHRHHHRD